MKLQREVIAADIAEQKETLKKRAAESGTDPTQYAKLVAALLADKTRSYHLTGGFAQLYADDPEFLCLVIATNPVLKAIADSDVRDEAGLANLLDTEAFKLAEEFYKQRDDDGKKGFFNYLRVVDATDEQWEAAAKKAAMDYTMTPAQRKANAKWLRAQKTSAYAGLTRHIKGRGVQHAGYDGGAPRMALLQRYFEPRSFATVCDSEVVMNATESLLAAVRVSVSRAHARARARFLSRNSRVSHSGARARDSSPYLATPARSCSGRRRTSRRAATAASSRARARFDRPSALSRRSAR